jgi:hypothetical protein
MEAAVRGIARRESWSAVFAAGVSEMAPLASAAGIWVIALLALGSWCRRRHLAAGAWLEARVEKREQISEISWRTPLFQMVKKLRGSAMAMPVLVMW